MIAKKHPAMAEFRRVPRPWWVHSVPLLMVLPPFALWLVLFQIGFGMFLDAFFGFSEKGIVGFMFHVVPVVGALFMSWLVAVGGTYVCGALLRYRDRRALGPIHAEEVYVGIAYADGFWRYENDHAWDRGYLRVTPDGLSFRGHATEFALPSHAIRGVRLASSRATASLDIPLVFVDWESPDGALSTLSLDGRGIFAFGIARRANVALAGYLESVLRLSAHHPLRAIWPPALAPERFVKATGLRVTSSDRLLTLALAGLAGMATFAGAYPYLLPFGVAAPPIAAGLFVIAYLAISEIVLNWRVARRLEAASKEPIEVLRIPDAKAAAAPEDVHLRA